MKVRVDYKKPRKERWNENKRTSISANAVNSPVMISLVTADEGLMSPNEGIFVDALPEFHRTRALRRVGAPAVVARGTKKRPSKIDLWVDNRRCREANMVEYRGERGRRVSWAL